MSLYVRSIMWSLFLASCCLLLACTMPHRSVAQDAQLTPGAQDKLEQNELAADDVVQDDLESEIRDDANAVTSPIEVREALESEDAVVMDSDTIAVELRDDGPYPKRVVLQPGTTVIWKNVGSSAVQVNFIGKAISTTCKAPRGFSIGGKGVYTSSPIAPGGIASLCFLEPELYVYEVRAPVAKTGRNESTGIVGAIQIIRN